ncbi:glycine betaine/proline transport system substrate-binding protein [Devosia sp. YR412]|uniref:glycine betaine ABC transporter substrate-binding protein n=1 Tax=Devosia sp. YR412 TaxID=1881030 RepID=UPI0008BEB036|nr:glycine betaine ABC transporter substrate-binding protein [Devosia sp. YR412]SEQ28178.1 glycine betaine/proline transport system substrate-binding protein [Devosia sp. YR412]
MTAGLLRAAMLMVATLAAGPALAQFTVLDQAQDAAGPPAIVAEPEPICGTQPLTVARMAWPSAELLAEIHVRLLRQEFGCEASTAPGDLAATGSSMGSTGQPAVAPEMWVNRIADVWNAGIEAQMLRPAAQSYVESQFEGWFMPDYLAAEHPELQAASGLAAALPALGKLRFISCPADWACAVINRNLVRAWGLGNLVELVEPANRFEMDTMIAEAVNLRQPVLFYYWQPNPVLAQLNFVALDMGDYNEEAARCLAQVACASPQPSAFASDTTVIALAEWVFTDIPAIAGYFQRASMPLGTMNSLLAQLSEPGATVEGVAERFVATQENLWRDWVGAGAP